MTPRSNRWRWRPRALGVAFAGAWLLLVVQQLRTGHAELRDTATAMRGALAALGVADPLDGPLQTIVELRLWRGLTSGIVGAALALGGALLQGMFRNGLAAPTVIGVNAGASLGAAVAILVIGGYAPVGLSLAAGYHPYLITGFAFAGALTVTLLVIGIASTGGRISVPTLLLTGIAVNACVAGILATIHSLVMEDWEVARALMAWTFGSFDDRKGYHVVLVSVGLLAAAACIPFLATELDLFAAGEDDAQTLGVHVARTKALALGGATLATACAVSAAGQIGFVGLIVPHLVRLSVGSSSHRHVLWLSLLGGAVFLTGTDLLQRTFLANVNLEPGVMTSLLGGPFFLLLLLRNRRRVAGW